MKKGPRPKGLKKFKPVVEQEEQLPYEELSENQKRKIEQKKKKAEEQLIAAKLAEDLAVRDSKLQEEKAKQAKVREQEENARKFAEDQKRRMDEVFSGLAKQQPAPKKTVSSKK